MVCSIWLSFADSWIISQYTHWTIQSDTLQCLDHVNCHSVSNSELSFSTTGRRLLLCQHKCSGCIIHYCGYWIWGISWKHSTTRTGPATRTMLHQLKLNHLQSGTHGHSLVLDWLWTLH